MKIIFAQGNSGAQYAKTRHNVGFVALDTFAKQNGLTFIEKPKHKAFIAETTIAGIKVLLVKPTTFYNETGRSARTLIDFYKCEPSEDVLVIHDDIALPFGMIRIRDKGSPAGNNGIKSLNTHIGDDFWRVRIGIYNNLRDKMHDADFVLSTFTQTEAEQLPELIFPQITAIIERFCRDELAPHSINTLPLEP